MKKTRLSFLFVGFFSLISLFGCSDDNDDNTPIDPSAAKINEVVIVSKDKNIVEIQSLEKTRRNEVLRAVLALGAGIRQASRLTGVSFGVIQKLAK